MLFVGDWDFWTDWKDRQWWPLVTPVITLLPAAIAQRVFWEELRLPTGATFVVLLLVIGQWAVRLTSWGMWVYYPVNMMWPANMVVMGVALDLILFWTRSYALTSLLGAMAFGLFFQPLQAPMISTYNQPVLWHGTLLSLADVQGYMYPRGNTPVYLRIVESGHFRAFLQQASYVIAFFAGFLGIATYWLGYWIGTLFGLKSRTKFFPGWGAKGSGPGMGHRDAAEPALTGGGMS
jgi:methane/ammonia monooxygenase subunit A